MSTLPPLSLDVFPRVLALTAPARLPHQHSKMLQMHYLDRGCVVIDVDQQTEPLTSAMPLLSNSVDIWKQIRLEIIQQVLKQYLSHPLVFLNLRPGCEVDLLAKQSRNTAIFTVFVNSFEKNYMLEKYPLVDLTLIYPHVLDSLL